MTHHAPESPEFLSALVMAAPVALVAIDLGGRVLAWNPAAESLFGWSAAEALGRPPPHVPAEYGDMLSLWLTGEALQPQRYDLEHVHRSGARLRLRVLTAPICDPQGRPIGVLATYSDVPEQLIAQAELLRQQHILQTIIDNIPVMIAFFDSDGRFRLVNREWERVLGWDVPSMNAQPDMMARFYPDPGYRQSALEYMQSAAPGWREFTTVTRSGEQITAVWANVRLADGTSIGIGQDVTTLRRQADELEHQLDLIQLLLESIPFGYIYVAAPSGQVLRSNSQAERILGHPIFRSAGAADYDQYHAYHPDGRPYAPEDYPVTQVLRTGTAALVEKATYLRGDGRRIVLRNLALPVRDPQGTMIGVISLFEDITDRLQLEERLLHVQKMESIGRLAGGIAHDFNNLLVPIIGYVDLSLSALSPDSKLYADLQQVLRAAERAADLTRQILAFSRRQVLEVRLLDLNDLVRAFSKLIQRLIGEDIEISTTLSPDLALVRADQGQIEQVLLNLVVNARDAMPNGGRLSIETANAALDQHLAGLDDQLAPGPYVQIAVSDTGHGMDPATRAMIFDPFFTTKAPGKGTGLGLSTVFGIIKQHRGLIWVSSEVDKGTTFTIYLPQATDEPPATGGAAAAAAQRGTETLLIVEDDPMVIQFISGSLQSYGYRILAASGPAEGFRLAATHQGPIHLLLTDVIMPTMNGLELYRRVSSIRPNLRVLYMSGYTDDVIFHHGILGSGIDFLQKPFTTGDLAQKIRQVLDR